jgi:hypothetical protein
MPFSPSRLGRELINQYFPGWKAVQLLSLAQSGFHKLNPYHNLDHELAVVYYSNACYVNEAGATGETSLSADPSLRKRELAIAALFHDHNHSGGRTNDLLNVKRAIDFINSDEFRRVISDGYSPARIEATISCTTFHEGVFTYVPRSFVQKCIRDADLMSIYTEEGRTLLVGLFKEMGTNLLSLDSDAITKKLEANYQFLDKAKMYTQYGEYMKSFFLRDACDKFAQQVKSYVAYANPDDTSFRL